MNNAQKIENAIKWIDGLRTTRVSQGQGCLGDKDSGYCCLGFGCMKLKLSYDPNEDCSDDFQKVVGLLSAYGTAQNWEASSLVALNDEDDYSFNEISKQLSENAELYFTSAVAKGIKRHYS